MLSTNIYSAYYRFSHRTLTVEVVAYRDIQPGEEITISCKWTNRGLKTSEASKTLTHLSFHRRPAYPVPH